MHAPDKKQQFIQLRADGKALGTIAQTLQVSKTTLWRWDQEEEEHIRELQLVAQEEAEEEWHTNRLERLANLQACNSLLHEAIVNEISDRPDRLSLKDMFLYQNLLRSEMEHYRVKPFVRPKTQEAATASKTEQKGTMSLQNGTAASGPNTLDVRPLDFGLSPDKTERNGTTSPENGTAAQSPTSLDIGPLDFGPPSERTEQNGTNFPENGTPASAPTAAKSSPLLL